jgi:hypothetical protein
MLLRKYSPAELCLILGWVVDDFFGSMSESAVDRLDIKGHSSGGDDDDNDDDHDDDDDDNDDHD